MGILEMPAAPDMFGLPEYHVTEVFTEIDGRDIRLAFGTKRFGRLEWLYTIVVSPENLIRLCRHCEMAAMDATNLTHMLIECANRSH